MCMLEKQVLEALESGLVLSTGCTEPVALAYAGALAASHLSTPPESIHLTASTNVIKNAFVVGIPGTDLTGLKYAVTLGALCKNPEKKLELLEGVTLEIVAAAKVLVEGDRVTLEKSDLPYKFYIEVVCAGGGDRVRVTLSGSHTNVTLIEKNGVVLEKKDYSEERTGDPDPDPLTLEAIFSVCTTIQRAKLALVEQAIDLNSGVSDAGLRGKYGLQVGRVLLENMQQKRVADDMANYAMMRASAASDARMAGVTLPIMTNSGSGNQGIAATLPVVGVWEKIDGIDRDRLVRACAMSNMATIHIKKRFGILSAFCGAVVAAAGAAFGITWLLGGTLPQMENAIQNTLGNVAGMLCDGAKASCALKISTCTNAAVQASILALSNHRIESNEGFVEFLAENTIENFAALGNLGSVSLDGLLLEMIINKK